VQLELERMRNIEIKVGGEKKNETGKKKALDRRIGLRWEGGGGGSRRGEEDSTTKVGHPIWTRSKLKETGGVGPKKRGTQ